MGLLPTEKSCKEVKLSKQKIIVYGRPKVGKSTFCSYFEDAIFLATEPGLNHLEVFKVNITTWEDFLKVCGEIATGDHNFKTVVIDTVDNLVDLCSDYMCKQNNIDHPGDLKGGKGWTDITSELRRKLVKLASLPYGLVIVSHSKQEEIETKTKKYNRFTIDIGGKNKSLILNMADIILFIDSEIRDGEEIGVIRTKPSVFWDAGDKSELLDSNIEYPLDKPEVAFKLVKEKFQ